MSAAVLTRNPRGRLAGLLVGGDAAVHEALPTTGVGAPPHFAEVADVPMDALDNVSLGIV